MKYLIKNIDQYVDDDRRYEENRSTNKIGRWEMYTWLWSISGRLHCDSLFCHKTNLHVEYMLTNNDCGHALGQKLLVFWYCFN